jgi:peptidoglycan/LPS O-acetylase OafA/YrhL
VAAETDPSAHAKFRADIQGLRAIAVISVVLYHAQKTLLPGGFVGVDVFFVISGFLISSILMNELDRGRYSLAGFYRRRIRRLFPALYVMLAAVLATGAILLPPAALKELGHTALTTIFFVSNIDFDRLSDYFAGDSQLKPLLHTWSLAVEEQFYVFFPLFLALLWRLWRKHYRLAILIVAVVSLCLSAWATVRHPAAAFFLAPSRVFELMIGSLTARAELSPAVSQSKRNALSVIGVALLLVSLVGFNDSTPFPGFAALLPCVGTALIILTGTHGSSIGSKIIGMSAIAIFFGDISYSLYLWHWPFLVFGRYYFAAPLSWEQAAALVLASVVVAKLSWEFIERPFLSRRSKPAGVLAYGGMMMVIGSIAAAVVAFSNGLPSRFAPETLRLLASADDYNHQRSHCHNPDDREIPYAQNCVYGNPNAPPIAAVWGDSHGAELVEALGERLGTVGQSVMQITASSCPPALDYEAPHRPLCSRHNRHTFEQLLQDQRITAVVLTADFIGDSVTDWPQLSSGFARVVEGLRGAGKTVVVVQQIPIQPFDPPIGLGLSRAHGRAVTDYGVTTAKFIQETRRTTEFLEQLARRTGAISFQPARYLCDENVCHAYSESVGSLYYNADHISLVGARVLAAGFPLQALVKQEAATTGGLTPRSVYLPAVFFGRADEPGGVEHNAPGGALAGLFDLPGQFLEIRDGCRGPADHHADRAVFGLAAGAIDERKQQVQFFGVSDHARECFIDVGRIEGL